MHTGIIIASLTATIQEEISGKSLKKVILIIKFNGCSGSSMSEYSFPSPCENINNERVTRSASTESTSNFELEITLKKLLKYLF